MKKLLGLLAIFLIFNSCDDGQLTVDNIDLGNAKVESCVNGILYKLNENEVLILGIPEDQQAFKNVVGLDSLAINSTNTVRYRSYNGKISKENVCDKIQPATPQVTEEWIAVGGLILINTTPVLSLPDETTAATKILRYNHYITFKNIVYAKPDGSTITFAENTPGSIFGDYTTTVTDLPFKFTAEDVNQCATNKMIYNVAEISTQESLVIQNIDPALLTETLGKKSTFGNVNEQLVKAEIGVLLHEIIDDVKEGDIVLFDDGMIKSRVISKKADEVELVITDSYKSKLSSHKGINLPNTVLNLPALTKKDIENLPFICEHADIVGYSFVRTGDDVKYLYEELKKNNAEKLGVVFKIENKEAFENLPEILIQGMERNKIGVMIARGDLAVEIGFERISEVQNQILWLCEAAHIPVIWATQVLENLAKTGIPTRAEISDAALGVQAECVMLNKGPYINEAIKILKDILIRMEGHSFKKKNELRVLNVAKKSVEKFLGGTKN